MHTLLFVSGRTASAIVNIATLAVILGAAAMIYSQAIETGLLVAAAAFLSGTLAFAYSVWQLLPSARGDLCSAPRLVECRRGGRLAAITHEEGGSGVSALPPGVICPEGEGRHFGSLTGGKETMIIK